MNAAFELNPLSAIRLLRSAGGALLAQAALHAKLASVEWAEEKARLVRIAIAAVLGIISAFCLILLGGIVAIALSWNTPYQTAGVASVLGFYALIAIASGVSLKRQITLGAMSFAATREEIAADLAMFKAKL
jgi:uncharacterized membrane protein YqjE